MQHKIPIIREVNLELIDVGFYHNREVKAEDVKINLDVKASFDKNNRIVFFIHIRYLLNTEEKERRSIFHTDYLSVINIEKVNWKTKKKLEIDKTILAHFLGMSFLMVRGAISNRLASNTLSGITLPVINPLQILEETLISKGDLYVLPAELAIHTNNSKL